MGFQTLKIYYSNFASSLTLVLFTVFQ